MKLCKNHQSQESTGHCPICHVPVCPMCVTNARGEVFCSHDHLEKWIAYQDRKGEQLRVRRGWGIGGLISGLVQFVIYGAILYGVLWYMKWLPGWAVFF